MADEETPCPSSDDAMHCRHWYDGEACCRCGAPAMSEEQKREQGMLDDPPLRLEFANEAEQARIDALPDDIQKQLTDLMRAWHEMRPDLNQPGMFGELLDSVEETVRLRS